MEDLQQLPTDVQLHIYDFFLALRSYQHKCRTNIICKKIRDAYERDEDEESEDESEDEDLGIPGIATIDVEDDKELRDSLPAVIREGYDMINFVWSTVMHFGSATLSKYSMSLDNDEEDAHVLRLSLGCEGEQYDAIYDIQTFECLECFDDDLGYSGNMVNVMKEAMSGFDEELEERYECYEHLERYDSDIERYRQWKEKVSNNSTNITYSDEFTKMRSMLHERCISRLSKV